jgi:hypothetical protein
MTTDDTKPADGRNAESESSPHLGDLVLSGQQQACLRALASRDRGLAAMYRGALVVLEDKSNPERLVQAAHSIRELMEKLPKILDAPTDAMGERMGDKVEVLKDAHSKACRNTACRNGNGDWDGAIDNHLAKFLRRVEQFFEWLSSHRSGRKKEINETLARIDGSQRALPPALAGLKVDAWDVKRNFFVRVSHHRADTNEEEFGTWLSALERALLDGFNPRTFEDFDTIDALLEEADDDAQA